MLRSVRAWLFGDGAGRGSADAPAPAARGGVAPNGDAQAATVAARQERAAERLLEDERLRGDLTDDEFQPLLDWALAASDGLAARTAGLSDDEADRMLDAGLDRIKDGVRTAGAAVSAMLDGGADARNAELARLAELVAPPLVGENAVGRARVRLAAALEPITANPDLAGGDLARAVAEALRALDQAAHEKDGPAA